MLEKKGTLLHTDRLLLAQLDRPSPRHVDEANNNQGRGFYDLWGERNPLDSASQGKDPWYLEQTKNSRVERLDRLNKKPSELPGIEIAAAGASYNLTYESIQDLMLKAHKVEVEKLKEARKLLRKLKFPT
ncbi:unnamed protein product [Ranitomeya imitator]|uniref:Ribosome biogenesis protein NOP53 n=1 Tax=Ranitomeya imitator TaxID=111125 RepID=A0ABN9M0G7_9NEOB|nr:unnamed protein product [Ranitomeya imitator]